MAPFFWNENKARSLESGSAAIDPMAPQVVALVCASVLIFLACLSSGIVLIRRHRLRHRTQDTTEAEAQVQLSKPVAPQSDSEEEKHEGVSPSPSSSTKSSAGLPLLPTTAAPRSGSTVPAEKPIEKLMAKTSAALSKVDKYTTLPLRRARQARQARAAQKNLVFDFLTPLATLDAEIVDSEANSAASRRVSHQLSMRSTSLTVGTETPPLPRSELLDIPPSNSGHSTLRPSPTVVSMEVRPLEADAAALPDAEGLPMLVSGSLPSFSSSSSLSSVPSVGQLADDSHAHSEPDSEADERSYAGLDCETPRRRTRLTDATEKGSQCASTASLSTMLTKRDSSFSSDADTVCEDGLGKASLAVKACKFDDPVSLSVSASNLSLPDLSSDKEDDITRSRPNSGTDEA